MEGPHDGNELLKRAAAEVFSAICQDRERVSKRLKPLFSYLGGHLFDENLTAGQWFRACGLRSHSYNDRFRNEVGVTPYAYYTQLRLGTAKKLLKDTDLEIWRLSELLGYLQIETFQKAFKRSFGLSPSIFRDQYRDKENGRLPMHLQELDRMRSWRKALAGAPERDPVLTEELVTRYPYLRNRRQAVDSQSGELRIDRRRFELHNAEKVWQKLKDREFSEQCLLIPLQISFETTALFDLLCRKSLEEGRKDRQQGVRVAMLALASLDACRDALGKDLPNRLAQGWTCLGGAFFLADDLASAEQALRCAELELEHAEQCDPLVEAAVIRKRAAIRWFRRCYGEALELVGQVLVLYRKIDEPVLIAHALILRGGISRHVGELGDAITDYREALALLAEEDKPYLCLCAQSGLANCHRLLGEYDEAEKALAEAEVLCEGLNFKVGGYQLRWIAGLVEQGRKDFELAERYLEEAHSGLVERGEMGYTAMVLLDLAILYAEEGRSAQVMKATIEALPLLEALQLGREATAAVKVLRDAVEANQVSLEVLKEVRAALADSQPPSMSWDSPPGYPE